MNDPNPFIVMVTTLIVVASCGASISSWITFFRSRLDRREDANTVGGLVGTSAWLFFGVIVLIGGNNEWWRSLMLFWLCLLAVPCFAVGRCIAQEGASLFKCPAVPAAADENSSNNIETVRETDLLGVSHDTHEPHNDGW